MLDQKIQDALNKQINAEVGSSYLYLAMAAYFESCNLKGMAHWMRIQSEEETIHVMRFFDYVNDRGGRVELAAIGEPMREWSSPTAAFEAAYKHECMISGLINKLVELAIAESDHASVAFLQWFVTEQVEEEASALEIRDKLKLAGDSPVALFMVDQELAKRAAPSTPSA